MIIGARWLGELLQLKLPKKKDDVYLVSRSKPASAKDGIKRHWIQADLAKAGVANLIAKELADKSLDITGIWEDTAFSENYSFGDIAEDETRRIIDVNLISAVLFIQKLLPNLRKAKAAKLSFLLR